MPYINTKQLSQTKSCKIIWFIQADVDRGIAANDLALALAFENRIDILFLQEALVGANLKRTMSKRHNEYQAYTSQEEWEERPRVIKNIRRNCFHRYIEKKQDQLSLN